MDKLGVNKTRIIIGTLLFLVYSYGVNKFTHEIGNGHYHDNDRLYDMCHNQLPNYEKYEWIGNLYVFFVLLFVLFKPSRSILILFLLLAYMIPIYFVRSIFTLVTVLPKSSTCVHDPYTAFVNGGCYDKIFSGHVAVLFVLTLLLNKYKIISMNTLIMLNIVHVLIVLMTRTHYTIDVIVSFCVSYLMYINQIRL
jgi:hypothetical protein